MGISDCRFDGRDLWGLSTFPLSRNCFDRYMDALSAQSELKVRQRKSSLASNPWQTVRLFFSSKRLIRRTASGGPQEEHLRWSLGPQGCFSRETYRIKTKELVGVA